MDLLVIGSAPDADPATESLRRLLRTLHMGTRVRVSSVLLRSGSRRMAWKDSCRDLLVLDDLRTWPPATFLDRHGPGTVGAHARGAALRWRFRRLPAPDVVLLDGPEAAPLLERVRPAPVLVRRRDRHHAGPVLSDRTVELIEEGFAPPENGKHYLSFGFDGSPARIAALDTRRAARRREIGAADRFLLVVDGDWSNDALEGIARASGRLDPMVVRVEALDDPIDGAVADVVLARRPDARSCDVIRSAVLGGATAVATEPVPDELRPWFDAVADDGDLESIGSSIRSTATVDDADREDRMRLALRRFDVEAAASRFESLLDDLVARHAITSRDRIEGRR